jgi:hypothetical protein
VTGRGRALAMKFRLRLPMTVRISIFSERNVNILAANLVSAPAAGPSGEEAVYADVESVEADGRRYARVRRRRSELCSDSIMAVFDAPAAFEDASLLGGRL